MGKDYDDCGSCGCGIGLRVFLLQKQSSGKQTKRSRIAETQSQPAII